MTAAPALPARPIAVGPLAIGVPVVLAPMAGVTNVAFRRLCREQGAGLCVSEMITSRGVVARDPKTRAMLAFDEGAAVRSVQLYGVEPAVMGEAVRILCGEHGAGHVDLNFGCPVPKVTRRGGGAALPWKSVLLRRILDEAVAAAQPYGVPVTVKTRMGIDDEHLTYLDAGRAATESGCAAIALHARTAAQHYSGAARWEAIAELKAAVPIPVLGNGDVWAADDAHRMMRETGCDGVVVGRGCLGRPWLFAELAAVLTGDVVAPTGDAAVPGSGPDPGPDPGTGNDGAPRSGSPGGSPADLSAVAAVMRRHAALLADLMGADRGVRDFRKHVAWYLKGFVVPQEIRAALGMVSTLAELDDLLARADLAQPYPVAEATRPRGRQGSPRRVTLPYGWLADRDGSALDLSDAEVGTSGG